MVLFGGLEVVAAGTLLHRVRQNRREAMRQEAEEDLRRRGWVPEHEAKSQPQNQTSSLFPPDAPRRPHSVPPPGYAPTGWQGTESFGSDQRTPQYPLGHPSQPYVPYSAQPHPPMPPPNAAAGWHAPPGQYHQPVSTFPMSSNQGYLAPPYPPSYQQYQPRQDAPHPQHHYRSNSQEPERPRRNHRREHSHSHSRARSRSRTRSRTRSRSRSRSRRNHRY
ncbi:uncharacterized protein PV09_08314 [Verruconis gallopava]|uniref:Uncharacterized protein n=1 Tax=Verruconis gallopava TaxID=253628 RepID=A0A0D1XD29_9PEZI|nr:uncharacterized protein PV09_08314 [Verruconis gallopava]KIW00136.1 hypothetical protein PV09_08314 [Verruconis gallopava]